MTSILGRNLPRTFRVLLLCLMAAIPVRYVLKSYSPETRFTPLLHFGSNFVGQALPQVKSCELAVTSKSGYDGQFYCQVAADPLLQDRQALEAALDIPAYRATRIFLPWLAYVAGVGRPCAIIEVFALLNLGFWLLLLCGMSWFLKPRTVQDFLCIFAVVMTSGALFSLHRALVDLPAATLAFYAASLTGTSTVAAAVLMLLTKESYFLALPVVCWPTRKNVREVALRLVIVLAPLAGWYLYAHLRLGFTNMDVPNTSWPGFGLAEYLVRAWHHWYPKRMLSPRLTAELFAPISLIVQACYLLVRRGTRSPYWRMGIGFVFSYLLLSPYVFVEQLSFTRDVIPLSLAFNILMRNENGWRFVAWFFAGNIGLYWGLRETLVALF
jgi:hypothetical protein